LNDDEEWIHFGGAAGGEVVVVRVVVRVVVDVVMVNKDKEVCVWLERVDNNNHMECWWPFVLVMAAADKYDAEVMFLDMDKNDMVEAIVVVAAAAFTAVGDNDNDGHKTWSNTKWTLSSHWLLRITISTMAAGFLVGCLHWLLVLLLLLQIFDNKQ